MDNFKITAKKNKGKTVFTKVDLDVKDNSRIRDFFGISPEDLPTVRIAVQGG